MRGVGHEDAHINPDPEVVSPIDKRDAKNPATFGQRNLADLRENCRLRHPSNRSAGSKETA
jgi:hypothetical protein